MNNIISTNSILTNSNMSNNNSPERKRYKKNDPEYNKIYYERNAEKIKAKLLTKVYCSCCQVNICKAVYKRHLLTAIHARFKQEFDQKTTEINNIVVC